MDRFARWVIALRIPVIVLVTLITLAAALAIAKWAYIESDISKYLPEDDPVVIRFNEAGERFGGAAVGMVGIEFDDVYSGPALQTIDRLTRAIEKVPGVSWVASLTEMDDVRGELIDGERSVSVSKVVDRHKLPDTPEELKALREYVSAEEQLVGVVVSADGRLANIAFNIGNDEDRVAVASAVEQKAKELVDHHQVFFGGFPYWMKSMSDVILRDMVWLVPIVTLVVIFILFLSFWSLRGVLLPMLTVLVSSTWAMGLMAALGIPITMLSNVIPVLLIALGTAYAIHLLHKVDELGASQDQDRNLSLRKAMVDVMVPICLAGITTVVGFLSFLTSNLVFIQHFGLMAAFGIFSAMLVALTMLPAILSFLKPAAGHREQEDGEGRFGFVNSALNWLAAVAISRRKLVLGLAVVIAAISAAFIPQLDRQFNMVAYFPEQSPVRKADRMMTEKLGGNVPIWLTVDGDPKHPFTLSQMRTAEKFLRTFHDVSNVRSIASIVAQMNQVMTDHLSTPESHDGVGNLWFNLEGKDVLSQFVDKEKRHALVQAVCKSSDTARLRVVVAKVEQFLAQLPQRARMVDLVKGSKQDLARAKEARLKSVALNLSYDLQFRLADDAPGLSQIEALLKEGMGQVNSRPQADQLTGKLKAFLLSDESDLEFTDETLAQKIAQTVAQKAAQNALSRDQVTGILQAELPSEMLEEDREGVEYLSKSIDLLVAELSQGSWVTSLQAHLLAKLPPRAGQDKLLLEEMDGDLWPLTYEQIWLPVAQNSAQDSSLARVELHQTGMHHISVNVDERLVFSQLSSLGLAAAVALLLLIFQFKSLLAGLLGMIPMSLTLLINFGVMGAFGIDLESSTVLIASLVVGVGIDYTIHFMSRTRLEMIRRGELASALEITSRTAGRAILINAITVTAGQLVFLAGELIPLHFFGILLALAMVTSALSAVTVMPAVLYLTGPKFLQAGKPVGK